MVLVSKAAADDPKLVSHVRFAWAFDAVISTALPLVRSGLPDCLLARYMRTHILTSQPGQLEILTFFDIAHNIDRLLHY